MEKRNQMLQDHHDIWLFLDRFIAKFMNLYCNTLEVMYQLLFGVN